MYINIHTTILKYKYINSFMYSSVSIFHVIKSNTKTNIPSTTNHQINISTNANTITNTNHNIYTNSNIYISIDAPTNTNTHMM